MAQNRVRTDRYGRDERFVYGSAAPKIDIRRQLEEVPARRPEQKEEQKRRPLVQHWSPAYIALLTICMVFVGYVAAYHVKLVADMTNQVKTISILEARLNTMREKNNEELARIENSVDMEEIRRIAITELGMTYAEAGQIVTYTSECADYMRKVVED